ncbi:hypothetical protein H6F67_04605 [Microcoleus sp. FACHB-1515]|uniref:hypothetical protein n=1 Tax=Cyanophyceae TaxID=3028117 RepID=UPI001682D8E1|nr:hypothetical protein [Microcoleus sp. FACHB-1515]MBD2089133.1 hypothetical protein [Microcoleus sp. FACHB-1515]
MQPAEADFHRGWLIEVFSHEQGFQSRCSSPCCKRLADETFYASVSEAIETARIQISYQMACAEVALLIRNLYEEYKLSIDEWQNISRSIVEMAIDPSP